MLVASECQHLLAAASSYSCLHMCMHVMRKDSSTNAPSNCMAQIAFEEDGAGYAPCIRATQHSHEISAIAVDV